MSTPIAPEDRVNMSLDDLIKVNKTTDDKKCPRNRRRRSGPKKTDGEKSKKSDNVAKVVGAGKAKRNAAANQRRGLNTTGKASKMDVAKAINKETTNNNNRRRRRSLPPGASPIAKAGLKISFKPAELVQTTDKSVIRQIRGALAKQGTSRKTNNNTNKNAASPSRSVTVKGIRKN